MSMFTALVVANGCVRRGYPGFLESSCGLVFRHFARAVVDKNLRRLDNRRHERSVLLRKTNDLKGRALSRSILGLSGNSGFKCGNGAWWANWSGTGFFNRRCSISFMIPSGWPSGPAPPSCRLLPRRSPFFTDPRLTAALHYAMDSLMRLLLALLALIGAANQTARAAAPPLCRCPSRWNPPPAGSLSTPTS